MGKYLNPKVDLTFKKVFGEHKNLVISLLNALLPLPEDMKIISVEYLTLENIPDTPIKKHSAVDVRCVDNFGRGFIVEMQSYWNNTFFSRSLFNAASMYTKQLKVGNSFNKLKKVYSLALVNSEAFDYADEGEYIQEFYLTNQKHNTDVRKDIALIFVELQKYKPSDKGSKAIKDLWMKFLTEIDESTEKVDDNMLENPEINQALNIVERSAYSDAEMYEYEDYLMEVMTQRTSMDESLKKGEEIGLEKGREAGRVEEKYDIARKMKSDGMSIDLIVKYSGLSADDIEKL